jgi:hypothetical protein
MSMLGRTRFLVLLIITAFAEASGCQRSTGLPMATDVRPVAQPVARTSLPANPSARESRGRAIYQDGSSSTGRTITAVISSGAEVPASLVACANCHGRDGHGVPEGTLIPPDLTWSALTKPYGMIRRDARTRPPYTDVLITRAITLGVDSAGVALSAGMPRYQLSLDECADLIAYLRRVGSDSDPGLTTTDVTLGVVLPPDAGGSSAAVREVLTAYFENLNGRGGVYHRRLVPRFVVMPEEADERVAALESFLDSAPRPFALISLDLAGIDSTPATVAQRRRVPLVAACGAAEGCASNGRWAFTLFADAADQVLALSRVARADTPAGAPVGIIHGGERTQVSLARAITERFACAQVATVDISADDLDGAASALRRAAAAVMLGPTGRMRKWLAALALRGAVPRVIVPEGLAERELVDAPRAFDGRIAVASPMDAWGNGFEGGESHRAPGEASGSTSAHRPARLAAGVVADLVVEALKGAGRDLDRDRYVTALESLRDFRIRLAPPLSFGPNRRVGAPAAYVVAVDQASHRFVPTGRWLPIQAALPAR